MKYLRYIFIITLLPALFLSCEKDQPFELSDAAEAVNLRIVTSAPLFDATKPDDGPTLTFYSENDDIRKVDLLVSHGESPLTTVATLEGSSFPSDGSLTRELPLSEIASALGKSVADFTPGDFINLFPVVTKADGLVYPDTILEGTSFETLNIAVGILNSAASTSFTSQMAFAVACPFVASEATSGNYLIVTDDFETTIDPERPIEIVAGPGENQVTFINLFSHPEGYDVTVTVDPATGAATVAKQEAWHCNNFGCAFGVGSVQGSGFFFSCSGFLTLDLTHTVDAGSFGTFKLELQRQ